MSVYCALCEVAPADLGGGRSQVAPQCLKCHRGVCAGCATCTPLRRAWRACWVCESRVPANWTCIHCGGPTCEDCRVGSVPSVRVCSGCWPLFEADRDRDRRAEVRKAERWIDAINEHHRRHHPGPWLQCRRPSCARDVVVTTAGVESTRQAIRAVAGGK